MKFLENLSLHRLALFLLGSLFVIFLIEFLILRSRIDVLEEIEEKKDYARSAQIESQQIAYLVQRRMTGQHALTADIYATVNELDHKLQVLGNGGRIDRSPVFLKPLSRLPRITYDNLVKSWNVYRENVMAHLPDSETAVATPDADSTAMTLPDSAITARQTARQVNASFNTTLLAGQWLTLSNWYEKLLADLTEEANQEKNSVENWFYFFVLTDLALLASLYFVFKRFILDPLKKLRENAVNNKQDATFVNNEMGALAAEINNILEQLKDATEFVAAIREGKLDFDYKKLDKGYVSGKNRLADSLISMQEKLKILNDEEHRRQWANEGLTKFVDILRSSNDNITTLGDKIISALVKYTNSNQGGLYVLNDDDENNKHLELVSLFAFDTRKFEKQKLKLGEGILGQTFLEKETTVLNQIPDEYIRITSGLGAANPKSLLIVPLKVDKDVYGIVELASFSDFDKHQIAFVEKLAETIASTLASVRAAQKNRQLIEQFQQQTEEMRAQEEEMRQNMEELQATQEELARKEQDYLARIRQLERDIQLGISLPEHEKIREELQKRITDHQQRIRELEIRLAQKPDREDDWALAGEVEQALRFQLDALRIAEQVASEKGRPKEG